VPELSIWLFGTSNITNDACQKIISTHLHDVAGSIPVIILIIMAANKSKEDNNVPK
jgi:hypothetical protein